MRFSFLILCFIQSIEIIQVFAVILFTGWLSLKCKVKASVFCYVWGFYFAYIVLYCKKLK